MILALARFALLLLATSALVGWLWLPSRWAWLFVLLLPLALFSALGAVLAFEFAFARAAASTPSTAGPPMSALLPAWWRELWATGRLIAWRVPFLSGRIGLLPTTPGQRGLVLVHGYACNRGVWSAWLAQLQALQVPCMAINLEPLFGSISDYSPLIEAAVADMHQQTGLAPVLVGHSMGGLAARAWWAADPTAQRLHRLITIGTPHQGTVMARFGHGLTARQMRPNSAWLDRLQAQETPVHASRTLCFYSACDNVVIPSTAAVLPGADSREVVGCAHVAMVDHPDCFEAALRSVRESG